MIIVPTRICNTSNCIYCNVYKKDFDYKYFENIDYDNFTENIIFLSEKFNDYNIRFFGGEPFLKFDLIKNIINKLSKKNKDFSFTINTNLSIIKEEHINYIKEKNIKLIISCNGNIESHINTRLCDIKSTIDLYKNIKYIIINKINYQINIVTTPETVKKLYENITFLNKKIGVFFINLLPVNFYGWKDNSIKVFEQQLILIKKDIQNKKLNINFINKKVNNKVNLFNSEIVIDSDGNIYPNMIVLETFFQTHKNKILISNINKTKLELQKDFNYLENKDYKIFEIYINKIINNKFETIIKNDNIISKIFGKFLKQI